jgi:AI-2 transport protein TqsA
MATQRTAPRTRRLAARTKTASDAALNPHLSFLGGLDQETVEKRLSAACLLVLTVYATGGVFTVMKDILMPFVMACFLAILFVPIVDRLNQVVTCACNRQLIRSTAELRKNATRTAMCGRSRKSGGLWWLWHSFVRATLNLFLTGRFPYTISVFLSLVVVGAVLTLIMSIVVTSMEEFYQDRDVYHDELIRLTGDIANQLHRAGFKNITHADMKKLVEEKVNMDDMIAGFLAELAHLFHLGTAIMIFIVYILLSRNPTPDHNDGVPHAKHVTGSLAFRIKDSVKLYLITKVSLSFVGSVFFTLILLFTGVKMAAVFGLIAFCLDFIPNIGAIIATFIPLPMIFLDPNIGFTGALVCFFMLGLMQVILGEVIEPIVLGSSMEVHPIVVLNALVFFGTVWGIAGMVLAVPFLVIVKLVLEQVNHPSAQYVFRMLEGFPDHDDKNDDGHGSDDENAIINVTSGRRLPPRNDGAGAAEARELAEGAAEAKGADETKDVPHAQL